MPLILPGNVGSATAATGFDVANSCRFNPGDSAYMHKTPDAGDRQKATFSCWIKRSLIGSAQTLFWAGSDNSNYQTFPRFLANDKIVVAEINSGSTTWEIFTDRVFKDISAWYHIVVAMDTTQATAANRVKIYVNGVQETSLNIDGGYPAEDRNTLINTAVPHQIGHDYVAQYYGGYVAEACFIEGSQNAPTDFGEFDEDSGIWKPIDVSGLTFGTNGFYLDFEASGNLGNDANGGTDLTEVNLAATDQTTDTCTNNFITLNPLVGVTSQTDNQVYSEGNTIIIPNSTDNYGTGFSTIGLKGGKWYWEAQIVWNGTSNNANFPRTIGFCTENYRFNYSYLGQDEESWGIIFADASTDIWRLEHGGSSDDISGATTMANGGTMNLALDLDNGKFYVGYNGTFFTSGDPTSGATGTGAIATLSATDLSKFLFPAVTNATNSTYYKFNFGNPAYAISSGNQDGDGFGNFEYAVPSGYFSINTKNLAEYG